MKVAVRVMNESDIDGVMEVEHSSFTIGWSRKSFVDEMFNSVAIYFVACEDEKIIGYAGMWDVSGEADITNIAVLPKYRGMGVGKLLLKCLFREAVQRGLTVMTLEVRESNIVAKNMYLSYGFQPVGIRKGYYADNKEDAIIMTVRLD